MKRSLTSIRHQRSTPFTSSNADVSVYTLMKLLGHEFMVTSPSDHRNDEDRRVVEVDQRFH